jgi:hypothetical protein
MTTGPEYVSKADVAKEFHANPVGDGVYDACAVVSGINVHPERPRPEGHVYNLHDSTSYFDHVRCGGRNSLEASRDFLVESRRGSLLVLHVF